MYVHVSVGLAYKSVVMLPSLTLEERLLLSSLKQPLSWFRFIDDVDMKWIHSDKELDEFFEHANSIHPSIKFTHEVSKTKLSLIQDSRFFIQELGRTYAQQKQIN
jgi:hypothetical protein